MSARPLQLSPDDGPLAPMERFACIMISDANIGLLATVAPDVFDCAVDLARARACVGSPDYAMIAAIADGRVIGQIRGFLQRQPDDEPWLYIDNLGVNDDWKRRGVATALLAVLTRWGKDKGASLVWLGSEPDNHEASGFYSALGFKAEHMTTWSKTLSG
jgi:ribosomal protein S18 acetylase RimI-like enzyme